MKLFPTGIVLATVVAVSFAGGCDDGTLLDSMGPTPGVLSAVIQVDEADVSISASPDGNASVELEVDWQVSKPTHRIEVENGVLWVKLDCPFRCKGTVDITLDAAAEIRFDSPASNLNLSGTKGNSTLSAGNGEVRLSDYAGEVELRGGSGDVFGNGLTGKVYETETSSGDLDLHFVDIPNDVDLETGSGDVTLRVPHGDYNIHTKIRSRGSKTITGLTSNPNSERRISVETGSGDITIIAEGGGDTDADAGTADAGTADAGN